MAIFSLKNDSLAGGEIQNLNKIIYEGTEKRNPYIDLIHPDKTARILKKQTVTVNWRQFYDHYHKYGRPDKKTLASLGNALGAQAVSFFL